jgi:phospholipase/carboxylesterase
VNEAPLREASEEIGGLRTIVVEPEGQARLVVVMLHGYAMLPEALSPFARSIGIPARFLLPEGPLEANPDGRAWWPIDGERRARALASGPRDLSREHPEGVSAARERLLAFLDDARSLSGGPPVVLVGFSQGGMLACDTVLRAQPEIAALALLSSSRITLDEWTPLVHLLEGLRVLVSHGEDDADLAFAAGEALRDLLAEAGAQVTWVPFEEGHEIPLVVWRALKKFLNQILRAT